MTGLILKKPPISFLWEVFSKSYIQQRLHLLNGYVAKHQIKALLCLFKDKYKFFS
jgi:hypothetical protein